MCVQAAASPEDQLVIFGGHPLAEPESKYGGLGALMLASLSDSM